MDEIVEVFGEVNWTCLSSEYCERQECVESLDRLSQRVGEEDSDNDLHVCGLHLSIHPRILHLQSDSE
jgi:hypothetical protein